jgi:hypothetical protein
MSRKKKNKGVALTEEMDAFITYGDNKKVDDYTKPVVSTSYVQDKDGKWVPSTTTANATPPKQSKVWCKHGVMPAFVYDNMTFYGGAGVDVDTPTTYDLVLDLARAVSIEKRNPVLIAGGPMEFTMLNTLTRKMPPIVDFNWKDFGIPGSAGLEFWRAIVDEIKRLSPDKVLVTCAGGHGRTGTCLSIIYGILDGKQGWDSIEDIRNYYCKQAVETVEQEDYIIDVLAGKL